MMMLLPVFNRVSIVVLSIREFAASGVHWDNGGLSVQVPLGVVTLLRMEIFQGSSNHAPAVPLGALASTWMPVTSSQCPDVSTRPPLPPFGPPVALNVP